ncbi:hypothetical protein [Aquibium microcysteis]|uniref:hypothetical protein n=1 Tax=Aquibium microcysteis TaxID=675281 RepID=UPI00165D0676|nr:hypothetical protein [Aquibium microcysteis]
MKGPPDFEKAMHDIYVIAKKDAGYNAKLFLQMLNQRGGLATAKHLINATQPSEGYTRLYERGRLDLTVEARVLGNPKWHDLFTAEEIAKAKARLEAYGYTAHL